MQPDRFKYWNKSRIIQLKRTLNRYSRSNETILALLDLTANAPSQWISFSDVCEKTGYTRAKAKADLGQFSKIIKELFEDNSKGWWPVDYHWASDPQNEGRKKHIEYMMPDNVASWWKEE